MKHSDVLLILQMSGIEIELRIWGMNFYIRFSSNKIIVLKWKKKKFI